MHARIASIMVLLLIAGCLGSPEAEPGGLVEGECDVVYPDGSAADCRQHASPFTAEGSPLGALCSFETVDGSVRLLRNALTDEVLLSLDLATPGTHGVVQRVSQPATLWSWQDARGDEVWSLGVLPVGERLRIQVFQSSILDTNDPSLPVGLEVLWSEFGGSPFGINHIRANGSDYYHSSMVHVEFEDLSGFALAHFTLSVDGHAFEARHERILHGDLVVRDLPGECRLPVGFLDGGDLRHAVHE